MVIFSINNNFYIFIGNINKTLGFFFPACGPLTLYSSSLIFLNLTISFLSY